MLKPYTLDQLDGLPPFVLSDALERGAVVHFPVSPVPLPSAEDLEFLRVRMPGMMQKKNVSYHPESDTVHGLQGDPADVARTNDILKTHMRAVVDFLERNIPQLAGDWRVGTASFRPLQERGRALSAHASNELVHVDALAYGATHGDRVLRFFINANDNGEDRVWITKGGFAELYERHAAAAGIAPPPGGHRLRESALNRLRTRAVNGLARLHPGAKTALDSSPYDRLMRRFHNYMKDTPEFQALEQGHQEFRFAPGSAWMTFTDMVSHACIEGQHAFADTFIVPLENCRLKGMAPYHVLAGESVG